MNPGDKPAKVQFTDGVTHTFDYVDPRESYLFAKEERDGVQYHRYIPWHQVVGVMRKFGEDSDGKHRNTTLQESADTENESLAGIQK